jgi:hypothetical protein
VLPGDEVELVWDWLKDLFDLNWVLLMFGWVKLFGQFFIDSFLFFYIDRFFFLGLFFIRGLYFRLFRVYFLLKLNFLHFSTCMRRLLGLFLVFIQVLKAKFLIGFIFSFLYQLDCIIRFRDDFILGER